MYVCGVLGKGNDPGSLWTKGMGLFFRGLFGTKGALGLPTRESTAADGTVALFLNLDTARYTAGQQNTRLNSRIHSRQQDTWLDYKIHSQTTGYVAELQDTQPTNIQGHTTVAGTRTRP